MRIRRSRAHAHICEQTETLSKGFFGFLYLIFGRRPAPATNEVVSSPSRRYRQEGGQSRYRREGGQTGSRREQLDISRNKASFVMMRTKQNAYAFLGACPAVADDRKCHKLLHGDALVIAQARPQRPCAPLSGTAPTSNHVNVIDTSNERINLMKSPSEPL